jgi:hypothetical protein
MKKSTVLIPIMTLALTTGVGLRSQAAALEEDRVLAVEVVNVDVPNKALRIRSIEGGVSSLTIDDDRVLSGLRTVRPGDRITISVRDEFTGQRKVVTAFVAGTITSKRPAARTVVMKQPGTAVEFVNLDPTARRITVLDEYGEEQIFHVDERAVLSMADVRPGQKVFLSYRYNIRGQPEAVVRVAPSSASMMLQTGGVVEVISADPVRRTLTFRTDSGERRTLMVDQRAILNLRDVRVGDSILVGTEDDRVVVITRR